jgi:hypothetical protein
MAINPSIKRPALLRVGMVLSFGVGALAVASAIPVAAGFRDLSRLRDTPLGSWGLPGLVMLMLASGALLLTIGFGIRDRKSWARPLMLAVWVLEGALNVIGYVRGGQARLLWVPFLLFSGWYLYGKQNVVGYFARSCEG